MKDEDKEIEEVDKIRRVKMETSTADTHTKNKS